MSMWLGPPNWNKKITLLARTGGAVADRFSSAANNRGKFNPNNPIPPICKALRRVSLTLLKLLQANDVLMIFMRSSYTPKPRVAVFAAHPGTQITNPH